MNATSAIPVAVADYAAGATLYTDQSATKAQLRNWAGGTDVGIYAQGPTPTTKVPLDCIRVDFGAGTGILAVWIESSYGTNIRIPGDPSGGFTQADIDKASADGYAKAKAAAEVAVAAI